MKHKLLKMAGLLMALLMVFAGCATPTTNESIADADATPTVEETQSAIETDDASETDTASGDVLTVAITQIADHPSLDMCRDGVVDKLAELGYVDGESIKVDFQSAQGDMPTATSIAQQFVSGGADVIVAIATPSAQAAFAAAKGKVPVVFTAVSEPSAAELAAADGATIAGVTGSSDKLPVAATFDLIKSLTPDAVKVGILHNTGEVNSDIQLAEAQKLAAEYGMEVVDAGITSTNEIASALDSLLPKVDVMMNLTDNMVVSALPLIVQKCNEAKIPLYGSEITQVEAGALASAGVDYYVLGQMTGEMVAKVLEGAAPESLPITTFKDPVLIVNSDQATLLGVTVPDEIADKVEYVTTKTE